jgi:trans-aconitate 2-methyltransferase
VSGWEPSRYLRFGDERTRPARELAARIPLDSPATVTDLGCGPGNSTRVLADRFPGASILGVDSSAEMVARARQEEPELRFEEGDVASWVPAAPVDVLYSNATLQWLPDHEQLLPRLFSSVAPGGAFAFQVPDNFEEPSHVVAAELAGVPVWRPVLDAARYDEILRDLAPAVDVWQTTYLQALSGEDPVVEWTRATGLRRYLDQLPAGDHEEFLAAYRARMREAYPGRSDGTTLFPFRRTFAVALAGLSSTP